MTNTKETNFQQNDKDKNNNVSRPPETKQEPRPNNPQMPSKNDHNRDLKSK